MCRSSRPGRKETAKGDIRASCSVCTLVLPWDDALTPEDNHYRAARALIEKRNRLTPEWPAWDPSDFVVGVGVGEFFFINVNARRLG